MRIFCTGTRSLSSTCRIGSVQYPKLAAADMRYDRQVVLEMQPGTGVPVKSDARLRRADVPGAADTGSAHSGLEHGTQAPGERLL